MAKSEVLNMKNFKEGKLDFIINDFKILKIKTKFLSKQNKELHITTFDSQRIKILLLLLQVILEIPSLKSISLENMSIFKMIIAIELRISLLEKFDGIY